MLDDMQRTACALRQPPCPRRRQRTGRAVMLHRPKPKG